MAEIPVRECGGDVEGDGGDENVQTCPFVLRPIINNTEHVAQICLIRRTTSFLRFSNIHMSAAAVVCW